MSDIRDFYAVVSFLLTSARGCINEPKSYGPFRLLDATRRLMDVLEARGLSDDFLRGLREKIEQAVNVRRDEQKFVESLDKLVLEIVEEVAER